MRKFLVGLGTTIAIITVIAMFLILPIVYVAIGWIAGFMVSLVFGDLVVDGLNALFNTTRFVKSDIPIITATLALFGSFFRSEQINRVGTK